MENVKDSNKADIIDLGEIMRTLWKKKKVYAIVLPIVLVLSCVWIFPEPRYYESEVSLAPEANGEDVGGGLSSIASSFGFNIGGIGNSDAIYPTLYPDLFESPAFLVSLFDIQIETSDGELKTDYYTYLSKHQKKNIIKQPYYAAVEGIENMLSADSTGNKRATSPHDIDPFHMTKKEHLIIDLIKSSIVCAVDKKTDVITLSVQDQDPLVCAQLADSIRVRLQEFIIQYRTSKARLDLEYYQHLTDSARNEYEVAVQKYSVYCDSHKDVVLQSFISQRDELENDMSLKFNTYTAMTTQLETMKAKVQERTPAFTTLKSATVPVKPAGPKRMVFVAGMMILATFVTSIILYLKARQKKQ